MIPFRKILQPCVGFTLSLLTTTIDAQNPGMVIQRHIDVISSPLSAAAHSTMIPIAAGEYPIGHDEGRRDESPARIVTLRAFAIDKTEVTNAQFAEFLNALELEVKDDFSYSSAKTHHFSDESWPELLEMGIRADLYPIIGLDDDQVRIEARNGRFAPAEGFEDHPVAESTWRGARDYCAWRGARLPSEAEWEAVAR